MVGSIEVREFKKISLEGGTVLDGFPSVGLATSIAATYLISTLNLDQVAALESERFPPLSMVYDSKPKFPARIYASDKWRIAVFLAEFSPDPHLDREIAKTMLGWAREHYCSLVISPVEMPLGQEKEEVGEEVFGVGSTERARQRLRKSGINELGVGIVAGVAGVLLNEGRWSDFDIISLGVRSHKEYPDARAAAKVVEAIDKLLPDLQIDVKPLYEEAEAIETRLKALRTQAKPVQPPPGIYG
jgi:uncharacterized protein